MRGALDEDASVELPQVMDLGSNREVTLQSISRVHEALLTFANKRVFIDMRALQSISPAAAVVLVAELDRCMRYLARPKLDKTASGRTPSRGSEALRVLAGLEAFRLLRARGVEQSWLHAQNDARKWFRIHRGSSSDTRALNRLIRYYKRFVAIDPSWEDSFQSSLVETSGNVLEHAYKDVGRGPWLLNSWWLAGFLDENLENMTFVFWDQGMGIPGTMRQKSFLAALLGTQPTDGTLIQKATQLSETSTGDPERRGRGLPALLRLIDESAEGGSMEIASGKGGYFYSKGALPRPIEYTTSLGGTLLVWSMQTSSIRQPLREVPA